jgi:hypothetical protein
MQEFTPEFSKQVYRAKLICYSLLLVAGVQRYFALRSSPAEADGQRITYLGRLSRACRWAPATSTPSSSPIDPEPVKGPAPSQDRKRLFLANPVAIVNI